MLTPLFHNLPAAALGAVVILAALKLVNVGALRQLARVHTSDFVLALVTLFGVLVLGVLKGIAVGVLGSLVEVLRRAVLPHSAVLGRLEGETVTYHGKYFSVDEVSIEPRPERRPELWVGGGSQLANEKSPDEPTLVPAVKRRILRGEGWIPRPTCPPEAAPAWSFSRSTPLMA